MMKFRSLLALLAMTAIGSLQAGTVTATDSGKLNKAIVPKEQSIYHKIWGAAQLYKNDANPVIEEFNFTGRIQLDYFNVNSSRGDKDFFEIRRFRLGFDSWWADRHVQFKATMDTNLRSYNANEVFYNRLTDIYLNFVINDALKIRVGKFEPHFGYDREFSDNLDKFFERSFFDDHVIGGNDYIPGVDISGKIGNWGYLVGAYSANVNKEFGNFDGGAAYLAEINYDFSKALGADKALWALDFMHADGKSKNTNFMTAYRNAAATYFDYQKGKTGLVAQLGYAEGVTGKGDIFQAMLMPTYLITDKLELVVRYQLGLSNNDNGLATKNRQEKTVGAFTGDTYNAGYVGLNYYLYGQKLKLMAGMQYSDLKGGTSPNAGYSGWTSLVGLRMYW